MIPKGGHDADAPIHLEQPGNRQKTICGIEVFTNRYKSLLNPEQATCEACKTNTNCRPAPAADEIAALTVRAERAEKALGEARDALRIAERFMRCTFGGCQRPAVWRYQDDDWDLQLCDECSTDPNYDYDLDERVPLFTPDEASVLAAARAVLGEG